MMDTSRGIDYLFVGHHVVLTSIGNESSLGFPFQMAVVSPDGGFIPTVEGAEVFWAVRSQEVVVTSIAHEAVTARYGSDAADEALAAWLRMCIRRADTSISVEVRRDGVGKRGAQVLEQHGLEPAGDVYKGVLPKRLVYATEQHSTMEAVYAHPMDVLWNFTPLDYDTYGALLDTSQTGAHVLDLGCGVGRNALALQEAGYDVFGVDVSAAAIERCRKLVRHPHQFVVGTATSLPFEANTFDVVLDVGCLHCLPDDSERQEALQEVRRVVVPRGRILSRIFTPRPVPWLQHQPFQASSFGLTPERIEALFIRAGARPSLRRTDGATHVDAVFAGGGSPVYAASGLLPEETVPRHAERRPTVVERQNGLLSTREDPHKITILAGGRSTEHDASIHSYTELVRCCEAARDLEIEWVVYVSPTGAVRLHDTHGSAAPTTEAALAEGRPCDHGTLVDVLQAASFVYSILHGTEGEDGAWQGLAEVCNLHGNFGSVASASISMCKWTQALVAEAECPELVRIDTWKVDPTGAPSDLVPVFTALQEREAVVKPNAMGASLLTTLVENPTVDALHQAVRAIAPYDQSALVQERIRGTEVTCGCLQVGADVQVLPCLVAETEHAFLGHTEKHEPGHVTVSFADSVVARRVQAVSRSLFSAMEFRDLCRFDYLIDGSGQLRFLEANSMPGLMSGSAFPWMLEAAGWTLADLIRQSLRNAQCEQPKCKSLRYAIES